MGDQLEKLAKKLNPIQAERVMAFYYGEYNESSGDMSWNMYQQELIEIIKKNIDKIEAQKIIVGKVKPFNSGYCYNLYACFDDKANFLYFQFEKKIFFTLDSLTATKASVFKCEKEQLRKLENLV